MMQKPDTACLDAIDPSSLDYADWLAVGMACHHAGLPLDTWDAWSSRDSARYRPGECAKKWAGFAANAGNAVTWGTVVQLARQHGWTPAARDYALEWNAIIRDPYESAPIIEIDPSDEKELPAPPEDWDQVAEITRYLSVLFQADEYVGYVAESWQRDGDDKYLPKKGTCDRTAGELLQGLGRCGGKIENVIGDYNPDCGVWVRFNPLDGQGQKDVNVTAFRYALVESDSVPVERQAAIYEALELPIAVLVHSGNRSLHAIVRINAATLQEYRDRVNYLYDVCKKNGLDIDSANRNPSRLSRLPGVWRAGQKQYLVAVNQGKPTFEAWRDWVEEQNDDMPEFESLETVWNDLPPLSAPLIDGVLRQGHKMLVSGPSKAGKSFLLLELAIAIAEGQKWLGWQCAQGPVLYVNLELDRASCYQRIRVLYEAANIKPTLKNIEVWNLRGRSKPLDALAPKLIRRAQHRGFLAIIIDPIYKVITGSENEADQMAHFCNQFDRICGELGAATIYCHHHSKGAQGGKASMDRASGSGVFARDPDAILDMIELTLDEPHREALKNRFGCHAIGELLDQYSDTWYDKISQDDALVAKRLAEFAAGFIPLDKVTEKINTVELAVQRISGWRMEATLREFAPIQPVHLFFRHPLHILDSDGLLQDTKAKGEEPPWQARRNATKEKKTSEQETLMNAYQAVAAGSDDPVMVGDLAEYVGQTIGWTESRLRKIKGLKLLDGEIMPLELFQRRSIAKAIEATAGVEGWAKIADVAAWLGRKNKKLCSEKWVRDRLEPEYFDRDKQTGTVRIKEYSNDEN